MIGLYERAQFRLEMVFGWPKKAHDRPDRTHSRPGSVSSAADKAIPDLGRSLSDKRLPKCGMSPSALNGIVRLDKTRQI